MSRCTVCREVIPAKRLELLPGATHCVKCSTEDKVSAIPVIHHKTGNEIQIVRDPEVAAEFHRLSSRVGFGTLRGLKAGVSGDSSKKFIPTKTTNRIIPKDDANAYERVGEEMMKMFELLGPERARKVVSDAIGSGRVSSVQGGSLYRILEALLHSSKKADKPVYVSYLPKDIKEKKIVSDEIDLAFRQWKKF